VIIYLKQNNQQNIRELTIKLEPKIQNRRLAVIYLLNKAFKMAKSISLTKLSQFLLLHENLFIIKKECFYETMCEEINIATISGLPFTIEKYDILLPATGINLTELTLNAPKEVLRVLNDFKI
jgi:hypothetical protein